MRLACWLLLETNTGHCAGQNSFKIHREYSVERETLVWRQFASNQTLINWEVGQQIKDHNIDNVINMQWPSILKVLLSYALIQFKLIPNCAQCTTMQFYDLTYFPNFVKTGPELISNWSKTVKLKRSFFFDANLVIYCQSFFLICSVKSWKYVDCT